MEAIVLAGGLGTRLRSVVTDVPKPMAPVSGKPFLYYLLHWLEKNGINRVILSVGYKWETIFNEFGDSFNSIDLVYSVEDSPLGTGGAIAFAMKKLEGETFFMINGDTLFNVDLGQLADFHKRGNHDLSIILKQVNNFDRYGTVEIDESSQITRFKEKAPCRKGLINGGIYIANKSIGNYFPDSEKFSFEQDFLEKNIGKLIFGGLSSNDYFIDIGIPEDYHKAQTELPLL